MKFMKSLIFTAIFLAYVCVNNASNILLLSPLGAKSMLNAYMGMFRPLAEKGHQLNVVSTYEISKNTKNIREVVLPSKYDVSNYVRNVFSDDAGSPMRNLLTKTPELCVDSLSSDVIQNLKKEKFDLVIMAAFMAECYLSLVHHFKVPLVYVSPGDVVMARHMIGSVGNPYFISLSGNMMLEGTYPFGYLYRLKATVLDMAIRSFNQYMTMARGERLCRESGMCPPDMPSFDEMRKNASLVVANSVKLLQPNIAPDMPHIIYGGGSHCNPAKPLPQDLEKWIQGSGENGFIYFSLGSAIFPSDMPESARKTLLKVFGKLKQRVLMNWDKNMDDLPSNVKLGKWLPQQDILAHPKMRVFISHGGTHSIMEITYHGGRMLGMPLCGDQYTNIKKGVNDGWAESLYWSDLSEDTLERKIESVLNNKAMDEIVAHRSKIMKDVPRPLKEDVIFWIEYVIRHKGAPHLRSPLHDMPLYVLYNADVWLSIISLLVGFLAICFCTFRAVFRCCFHQRQTSHSKKKKQ